MSTKLPEDDFSLTETELRAELARLRRIYSAEPAPAPQGALQITKRTPEQAVFALTLKALGLQNELRAERDRCDTWRKLANGYEDIRSWLRLCDDNAMGHAEFYRQACLIVFGTYRDDEFADDDTDDQVR